MKNLLILCGVSNSGKSTWIKKNNLEQYTINPDKIRLMFSNPIYNLNGELEINQKNDNEVFKFIRKILDKRLDEGQFTIIDSTNTLIRYFKDYKKLAKKYGFKIYIKVFDENFKILKKRNEEKNNFKKIPEKILKKQFENFQNLIIPEDIIIIKNIKEINEKLIYKKTNKNIFFVGDIHGVFNPLKNFLDDKYNKKDLFVFIGDYIDRGKENKKVLEKLIEISKNKNCIFLEGNHERWLKFFIENKIEKIKSKQFLDFTLSEISTINKKELKLFLDNLIPYIGFEKNGKKILASHGGISNFNSKFINIKQLIYGVGEYPDIDLICENLIKTKNENEYLIFGHRKIKKDFSKKGLISLEGEIENGGELRTIYFSQNNIEKFNYKSNYFFKKNKEENFFEKLKKEEQIIIKNFGRISSCNFSKKCFQDKNWNDMTIKSRGLFVDFKKEEIIARGYDKFFKINGNVFNQLHLLKNKLEFPITFYKKENGFFGILTWDSVKNELLFLTKSMMIGKHCEILKNQIKKYDVSKIENFLKNNKVSIIFEIISNKIKNTIKNQNEKIVMLDIIHNKKNYENFNYEELKKFGKIFEIQIKKKIIEIFNWEDFLFHYKNKINEKNIEGFVIVDKNNYMLKLKTDFYNDLKKNKNVPSQI